MATLKVILHILLFILSLCSQDNDTALHFVALHNNVDTVVAIFNCTVQVDLKNRVSINISYILMTALCTWLSIL